MISFDNIPAVSEKEIDNMSVLSHQQSVLTAETANNRSKAHAFLSLLRLCVDKYADGNRLVVPEISKGFLDLIGCPAIHKLTECNNHLSFILEDIQTSQLWWHGMVRRWPMNGAFVSNLLSGNFKSTMLTENTLSLKNELLMG